MYHLDEKHNFHPDNGFFRHVRALNADVPPSLKYRKKRSYSSLWTAALLCLAVAIVFIPRMVS